MHLNLFQKRKKYRINNLYLRLSHKQNKKKIRIQMYSTKNNKLIY